MKALTYTSFLGLLCLVLELFNLRKMVVSLVLGALAVIFYLNLSEWNTNTAYYHNMLKADNFSVAFTGLLLVIGFGLTALSGAFFKQEESKLADYVAIIVFTLCGAIAMVSFANMAMLFIGIEVLSISLYILAGSKRRDVRSNEAAMKYFLMGSFASGILLFGITLIYGVTGSFDLAQIASYAAANGANHLFLLGMVMILIAMLFKVSAAPFHFWAPDVYEGSPMLITAMMATLAKVAAMAALYRLFSMCFTGQFPVIAALVGGVAAITMLVGNLSALNQESFKRMLAFSGIAHAGYMLLAIVTLDKNTPDALFFYATAYALTSIGAFSVAAVVARISGTEKIEGFNGFGKKSPLLAGTLTLLMLSMAGIPPFAGFFAKYYVFLDAIRNGHVALVLVAVLTSIISIYFYLKVIIAMWVREGIDHAPAIEWPYKVAAVISLLLVIALGISPDILAGLF
ncbi:MAG: NADH-quinone oxidoreductase subunit N [Chitinophagales bacterium]